MREIIEDTISRNREFQKQRQRRVASLKAIDAPEVIIRNEEMIAKMTLAEYKVYCNELQEERKKEITEYARKNPIQKSIVDEIYRRESELPYEYMAYYSQTTFVSRVDPLQFMSTQDFMHDLYATFIDHALEIYRNRYANLFFEEHQKYVAEDL